MAKLKSATIRLVQKLNRQNKKGEFPIYIVVCYKGRKEKACGISCLPKYWDSKREVIKPQCSNAPMLNKMLSDIKQRVIDRKNNYELNGRVYTSSMLLKDSVIDFSAKSNIFKPLMDALVKDRRLKFKTIDKYKYTYDKLCEFIGKDDFVVDELNIGFIKDFCRYLSKTISDGTIRVILSCIASVWNYAILKKLTDGSDYPFYEFKFTSIYKGNGRDYFLDESHIIRLKEYWLDLCIEKKGKMWHYKDGVEERLMKRSSKEFSILWFLLCYKLNGSAPVEIAHLTCNNCKRMTINGEDYWCIDFKRKKTSTDVHVRWKRDLFAIIGLEHYMGRSKRFIYPIISDKAENDVQIQRSISKASETAIKCVRKVFEEINAEIIKENVEKGLDNPLIECNKVVMYTARHSFACHYLKSPNSSVSGLASLLSRSPNTISTYIHQLTNNSDIAKEVENMPI